MNSYQQSGLDERRDLYQLMATGQPVHQIAAALRRHRSAIYREPKRNWHLDESRCSWRFRDRRTDDGQRAQRSWRQGCVEPLQPRGAFCVPADLSAGYANRVAPCRPAGKENWTARDDWSGCVVS